MCNVVRTQVIEPLKPRYSGHNPDCQFVGYYKNADIYRCDTYLAAYSFQWSDSPGDYSTGAFDTLAHLYDLNFPEEKEEK